MATKIRLQRHGKKRYAYYHIVVADSRAKRDGKNVERLGSYNPNTNPATIDINFDRAVHWVKVGAQPTDTARAILSYKGVLMRTHLDKGVLKGAFSQDEADKKFEAWMKEKDGKITAKAEGIAKEQADAAAKLLADEKAKTEAKLAEAAAAEAEALAAAAAAEAGEEAATEEAPAAEVAEEAPAAEVAQEAPAAEVAEEAPAAEVAEEAPAAEVAEEAPAAEVAEEAPAAEAETSEEEEKPAE